jgi:hypothetical protein
MSPRILSWRELEAMSLRNGVLLAGLLAALATAGSAQEPGTPVTVATTITGQRAIGADLIEITGTVQPGQFYGAILEVTAGGRTHGTFAGLSGQWTVLAAKFEGPVNVTAYPIRIPHHQPKWRLEVAPSSDGIEKRGK